MTLSMWLALGMLCLITALVLFKPGRPAQAPDRTPEAVQTLREAAADTIASGNRLHLALGSGALFSPANAAALANYETFRRLQQLSLASDKPAVLTSADPTSMLIGQDLARSIARTRQQNSLYHPAVSRMPGVSPLSYALGAGLQQANDAAQTVVLLGDYGTEGFYPLSLAGSQATSIAASTSLTGQTVALAGTNAPTLLAEEVFTLPAYLSDKPSVQRMPRLLDVLRWVVILVLSAGVLLQLLATLMES